MSNHALNLKLMRSLQNEQQEIEKQIELKDKILNIEGRRKLA